MSARDASAVIKAVVVYRTVVPKTSLHLGVLVLLAYHVNADRGGFAWPSKKRLAEFLNVSPRQIQRVVKDLERAELIRRFPPLRRGGNHRFQITLSQGADVSSPEDTVVSPDLPVTRDIQLPWRRGVREDRTGTTDPREVRVASLEACGSPKPSDKTQKEGEMNAQRNTAASPQLRSQLDTESFRRIVRIAEQVVGEAIVIATDEQLIASVDVACRHAAALLRHDGH
jgi:hypothetical protein